MQMDPCLSLCYCQYSYFLNQKLQHLTAQICVLQTGNLMKSQNQKNHNATSERLWLYFALLHYSSVQVPAFATMMFVFSTNLPGASCRITILTQSRRNWEGQGGNCHPNPHILKGINGIKEKILDYYLPRPRGISDPPTALLHTQLRYQPTSTSLLHIVGVKAYLKKQLYFYVVHAFNFYELILHFSSLYICCKNIW